MPASQPLTKTPMPSVTHSGVLAARRSLPIRFLVQPQSRPKLDKLIASIKAGDVLTVWRLDRLGRSLPHLIEVVRGLEGKGAHLQSLTEGIDTTTAQGRLTFHLMGALAEFERSLIVERTQAGLTAAKRRGVRLGRPKALTPSKIKHAQKLREAGERVSAIAASLEVDRSTLYRALKA